MSRAYISQEKQTISDRRLSNGQLSDGRLLGSRVSGSGSSHYKSSDRARESHPARNLPRSGAPRLFKRYVRWLFNKDRKSTLSKQAPFKSSRKAAIATGSVATLALLAVVPGQVSSQRASRDLCQEVVQSGAEISRGELASLGSIPLGETNEAVRAQIDVPYCLLPVSSSDMAGRDAGHEAADDSERRVTAREAYPLAFDPDAWVVVNYSEETYVGYDFAFKP